MFLPVDFTALVRAISKRNSTLAAVILVICVALIVHDIGAVRT